MLQACLDEQGVTVAGPNWKLNVIDPKCDEAVSDFMGFRSGIRRLGSLVRIGHGDAVEVKSRYFVSTVHVLATATMATLQAALPESAIDVRRFRPNIVIDSPMSETQWVGREMNAAAVSWAIVEPSKRCGMTLATQPGIPEDGNVLRTIVRNHGRCLGVYANVVTGGQVAQGDVVSVS